MSIFWLFNKLNFILHRETFSNVQKTYVDAKLFSRFVCPLHRFAAVGDICFRHSISLNTICAPPPHVGNISA